MRTYPPTQITIIPRIPHALRTSPKNMYPVIIINAGVKARNGIVSESGETFIDLI